jgi:xylan 1,4-beta-xylosidase
MVATSLPPGSPHGGPLRDRRGCKVGVGGLKRVRHVLLAGDRRRLSEVLRLHRCGTATGSSGAHVGGPATAGPANQRAVAFLRQFLEHCASAQNHATGKKGAPLDFISFHAIGKAVFVNGHVKLNLRTNLRDIDQGIAMIEKFSTLRQLPVILSESDPEGCAACDATSHPENGYRLTSQYASYEMDLLHGTLARARLHHINLEGTIAWAFTFPGQPIFAGFRSFTTNEIDQT